LNENGDCTDAIKRLVFVIKELNPKPDFTMDYLINLIPNERLGWNKECRSILIKLLEYL